MTAGQTNYIDVDGKAGTAYGSNGGVNLIVTMPLPPANDLYANRTILYPSNGVPVIFGTQTELDQSGREHHTGHQLW